MHRLPSWFLIAILLLSISPGPVAARTWLVPSEVGTIAAALDSAVAGDVVEIACGSYLEHDLQLKGAVVLRSEDGVAECVTIDAQGQGRVLLAADLAEPAVLLGLTITGGAVPEDELFGGGIHCQDASLSMAQCVVRDNRSTYAGGGLFAQRGTLLITSTVFVANEGAVGGGGAARLADVDGEFLDCRFEQNVGVDGAAIYMSRTTCDLNFCTFFANEGQFFGGAIFCVTESEPRLSHCTLVGNAAYLGGGIMVADRSHPSIEDCLIAFNEVGSGVDVHDAASTATVLCSDVHGNEAGGYSGYLADQTGLNGNIDTDPSFCDLATGDLSLAGGSPCLPAGNDCQTLMGAHGQGCVLTDTPLELALPWRLGSNRPNPFNPRTTIEVELDEPLTVTLVVLDVAGRRVATLHEGRLAAGRHALAWHGDDERGRPQPSGTYFYRLAAAGRVESRTMLLVR